MKIYGFSGLGADKRVFEYLQFEDEFIPIDWIEPRKNERLEDYALRLAEIINTEEKFGLLGLSFGGLIAVEISKNLKPQFTILISSVETRKDLPLLYRILGKSKILKILPKTLFKPPKKLAYYFFGAKHKKLLQSIINDADLGFVKWATQELLTWRNETKINNCLKIVGDKDHALPPKKANQQMIVKGGKHFMIVDKAAEVSNIIKTVLKNF